MKNYLLILLSVVGFFACQTESAEKQIPTNITEAFQKQFPGAAIKGWDEGKDGYEVVFLENGVVMEAKYDKDGKLQLIEEEIEPAQLPEAIQSAVEADFASYEIVSVDKIIKGDIEQFEVDLKEGSTFIEVLFDSSGQVVKQGTEEDDDDGDDDDEGSDD
ncbi:MAG: PepSY-like domain-containing protein [Bacteroidetes bacterium]|nr:PepSY-like domain-containing protein [Bacteroidota bacterium]MCB0847691.1 PepSY-like domain-containing protein [Bacteroidota bacterium]